MDKLGVVVAAAVSLPTTVELLVVTSIEVAVAVAVAVAVESFVATVVAVAVWERQLAVVASE